MGVLEKTVTGEFRLLKTVILTDKSVTCFNFTVVLIYFTSQSESLLCARKCYVDIRNSNFWSSGVDNVEWKLERKEHGIQHRNRKNKTLIIIWLKLTARWLCRSGTTQKLGLIPFWDLGKMELGKSVIPEKAPTAPGEAGSRREVPLSCAIGGHGRVLRGQWLQLICL